MSTPSEHAPTEPQPVVDPAGTGPPATTPGGAAHRRSVADDSPLDRLARLAVVVIAAVLVIFLILLLAGYPIHMKVDKSKTDGGHHGVKQSQPAP